jgi:glutamine synthetase adenylyltransferase
VWDVKNVRGGLVDVEFIARPAAAPRDPIIRGCSISSTARPCRDRAAGLLDRDELAAALGEAYALCVSQVQAMLRLTIEDRSIPRGLPPDGCWRLLPAPSAP